MNNITFYLLALLFCMNTAIAKDSCKTESYGVFDEKLKSIIAPHAKILSEESICSGNPIFAHTIGFLAQPTPNCGQMAEYFNGYIITFFGYSGEGCKSPELGEQVVHIGIHPNSIMSVSKPKLLPKN